MKLPKAISVSNTTVRIRKDEFGSLSAIAFTSRKVNMTPILYRKLGQRALVINLVRPGLLSIRDPIDK